MIKDDNVLHPLKVFINEQSAQLMLKYFVK